MLRHVDWPLAAEGILDTLRTAHALAVAMAAASTLGTLIAAGLQNRNFVAMGKGA